MTREQFLSLIPATATAEQRQNVLDLIDAVAAISSVDALLHDIVNYTQGVIRLLSYTRAAQAKRKHGFFIDQRIAYRGDLYRVGGIGNAKGRDHWGDLVFKEYENECVEIEQVYLHLFSLTRGRKQRNGWVPAQIADWVNVNEVEVG